MPATLPEDHRALGIDLGAATTRIAMLDPAKPMPVIVRNELSNEATSTIVSYPSCGARCYGENAAAKQITKPTETVVDLAPWLFGSTVTDEPDSPLVAQDAATTSTAREKPPGKRWIGEEERHPVQVAAYFIKSILSLVPGDAAVMPVCMSVPTCVSPYAISSLRQACLLAGVKKENTIIARSDEAMAAYFHHIHYSSLSDDVEKPMIVTILDIGQSCCSACVVAVSKQRVTKVAAESLLMGSGYIDAALCGYVYSEVERLHGTNAIYGDVKAFRKIMRECRKAKEILSTVEETRVQLEAVKGDLDINIPISRTLAERISAPLLSGLRDMFTSLKTKLPPLAEDETEPRVEVIGGGWRTTFVTNLIKEAFGITRVGVTLDANLSVAEGSAILAEVCTLDAQRKDNANKKEDEEEATKTIKTQEGKEESPVYMNHTVELVGFEATDSSAATHLPLSPEDEAEAFEWAAVEAKMAAIDASIHQRLSAINQLDAYVLQTLEAVENSKAERTHKDEARSYLLEVDDYLRGDCEGATTETIHKKLKGVQDHVAAAYPEVAEYYASLAADEKLREEKLKKLSEEHKQEDNEDLKSDPQRLRMAQRRREQGQALFKQECWQEAQTRFVQALSALGQLYDTKNEEYAKQKQEISLSCHLNIASCSVKLGLWRNAVNNCTSALDLSPDNGKALFRRGQALAALKEYQEAIVDLEKARVITNEDPGVMAEFSNAKKALEAQKAKEKKMFARMFS